MQAQSISIQKLHPNTGQIPGLPKNPRLIKDGRFERLVRSIQDDPEMLQLREVIAYDNDGQLVVIAGNMRLRACQQLGYKEVPTKVLPKETPVEKLQAYTIKDNVPYGENDWEALTIDWDQQSLIEWGLELPDYAKSMPEEEKETSLEMPQWFLNIRCNSEEECQRLYEEFIAKGLDVKIVT